jgi:hypothetical protein
MTRCCVDTGFTGCASDYDLLPLLQLDRRRRLTSHALVTHPDEGPDELEPGHTLL